MLSREESLALLHSQVKNKNLIKHMLAAEAVMGRLADYLGEDRELWSRTGLLHDLDYDRTAKDPENHGLLGAQMLEERGCPAALVQAVRSHNPALGQERATLLDKALYAVDPVTGLLVAAALVHPEKKLAALDVDFVMKRFGEKAFARGANRDQIRACSELGLSLRDFIALSLEAMQSISEDLGL
ncbi:MAG TPA: HDIG domain-containing protein [Bacillota bacterium]|mgnify:CR=1 FL=1|jgi:putative nucleotidyltransferase with HDIG domain|nr:HDIG domain-containing protein [Bacillota bacterium]HOB86180.1 HDIG domain-containing protein [Bacillota bacterium]HOP68151.1 HDIG domain-containing protein [Bacillota bacterium]HPT33021.1 HDIG domain-containing protein [Bacillota bacterium]HPZ64535.1 HDIG domain-containing protein [Bacillota bacterium]